MSFSALSIRILSSFRSECCCRVFLCGVLMHTPNIFQRAQTAAPKLFLFAKNIVKSPCCTSYLLLLYTELSLLGAMFMYFMQDLPTKRSISPFLSLFAAYSSVYLPYIFINVPFMFISPPPPIMMLNEITWKRRDEAEHFLPMFFFIISSVVRLFFICISNKLPWMRSTDDDWEQNRHIA